jgi:putative Mg2+ transporter-C (MgtC) family protein
MLTCDLICLGTDRYVRIGALFAAEHSNPTRVIGQLVTGIGFLDGSVIFARAEVVTGVTRASNTTRRSRSHW